MAKWLTAKDFYPAGDGGTVLGNSPAGTHAMEHRDRPLLHKLATVLVIKLLVLTALWWGFVRDQRVPVDTDATAMQMLGSCPAPTASEE
jgi:hypothetical protein